ncbi:hypothetical protein C6P40_005476, partial [Pichia californica]
TPAWNSGNRSSWGGDASSNYSNSGGKTEYGGAGSVWGGDSAQNGSNTVDWGVTPSVGDWDAPTPSYVKKEEHD